MCGHQPCPDPLSLPCPTGCSKSDVFCHLWCPAVAPLPADTLQPWRRAGVFMVLAPGLPPLMSASPHRDPQGLPRSITYLTSHTIAIPSGPQARRCVLILRPRQAPGQCFSHILLSLPSPQSWLHLQPQ